MLGSYNIHTDLALEDKERFESDNVEISGVSVEEFYDEEHEIRVTEVKILTENGAKSMRKPIGTYITMEMANLVLPDEEYHHVVAEELSKYVGNVLQMDKENEEYTVLVVGLGNRDVTPDALGPHTVECLNVTRHIVKEYGKYAMGEEAVNMVSAIAPGVMAQTGMESYEIIKGIVETTKPDAVLVVDALAARNTKRLNRTIQIADTGIHPGSGVGNHRNEISKETLGIPVIAIGVPTVVDAATIVRDTMENLLSTLETDDKYEMMQELIAPHLYGMFVTPKDIDESIDRIGATIAEGLNILFTKGA
ncbi:MAG: GPR endopeptidase [Tyzzerella sp.]|nr:GPR endopeptidase [Tyzzerella sp.]